LKEKKNETKGRRRERRLGKGVSPTVFFGGKKGGREVIMIMKKKEGKRK